jgi:hypothetical protein
MNTISTVEHLRLRENRLTAELADVTSMYNRCVDDVHAARVERDALQEGLDGWHSRYLDCEVERDAALAASRHETDLCQQALEDLEKVTAENAALRIDAMRYRFIFAESDRVDPVCAVVWKKGNVRNSSEWVNSVGGEWLSKELDDAIGEKK